MNRYVVVSMDPSPFVRTSFWTILLSLTVNWMANSGVGQTTVQRFFSVPDLQAARRLLLFGEIFLFISNKFITFDHKFFLKLKLPPLHLNLDRC